MARKGTFSGDKQPRKGSRKGIPNKTTVKVKEAVLNAFDTVGGQQYLVMVALTDPKTFCTLLGRVLPAELNLHAEVLHEFSELSDTERSTRAVAILDAARERRVRQITH